MLVFVDFEHADGHAGKFGPQLLAARTSITYRLEDLARRHCHLVRYNRIDQALLDTVEAEAIFISGNSIAPDQYAPEELESIHTILRETSLPVFGFCGGFQLLAQALGVDTVPNGARPEASPAGAVITTDEGTFFERGYHPIDCTLEQAAHPLFEGLGPRPVFRHAHGLQVPVAPAGFQTLASTPLTPIQMVVDDDRKIVGTQFHPEYWTDEHPAGRTLLANFLSWAGLGP